ncbi:hypothetical protein NPIL_566711 [Nephila pilipes]|uniref:Uncharacterized protein n=1 Tax=Nephila pilipes TaxID=299642 RepID=A0A8X6P934_NEPPI|nr:hypothetical protein NPIL_566711 [Nephila pilipes]
MCIRGAILPNNKNKSFENVPLGLESECDCGENGKCYTDTEGKPNCDCNPGFLVIEKDGAQYCSGKIPYKSKNHF